LNTDLIYKAFTFQVGEMCPLFVVGKVRTYSLRHRKDETAVVHVQPKAATHKLIFGIARKGCQARYQGRADRSGSRITFKGEAYSFALTQL
jgi:hypothetical protein